MDVDPTGGSATRRGPHASGEPEQRAVAATSPEADRDLASSVSDFAEARVQLAKLEAADAARVAARKGGLAGGAVAAAGFAWALLLAGGLGLAVEKGLPWHWIAIGTGLLHLLLALVFGICLAVPGPPMFPLTRRELAKDRTWLENLKTKLKSRG